MAMSSRSSSGSAMSLMIMSRRDPDYHHYAGEIPITIITSDSIAGPQQPGTAPPLGLLTVLARCAVLYCGGLLGWGGVAGPVSLGYLSAWWGAVWSVALYPLEKQATLARLVSRSQARSRAARLVSARPPLYALEPGNPTPLPHSA
jgi:hypothetical protein